MGPLKQKLIFLLQCHLIEASFGNVDVAVAHLHVDPQALHHGQTVLVVPQVLKERVQRHKIRSVFMFPFFIHFSVKGCCKDYQFPMRMPEIS